MKLWVLIMGLWIAGIVSAYLYGVHSGVREGRQAFADEFASNQIQSQIREHEGAEIAPGVRAGVINTIGSPWPEMNTPKDRLRDLHRAKCEADKECWWDSQSTKCMCDHRPVEKYEVGDGGSKR